MHVRHANDDFLLSLSPSLPPSLCRLSPRVDASLEAAVVSCGRVIAERDVLKDLSLSLSLAVKERDLLKEQLRSSLASLVSTRMQVNTPAVFPLSLQHACMRASPPLAVASYRAVLHVCVYVCMCACVHVYRR